MRELSVNAGLLVEQARVWLGEQIKEWNASCEAAGCGDLIMKLLPLPGHGQACVIAGACGVVFSAHLQEGGPDFGSWTELPLDQAGWLGAFDFALSCAVGDMDRATKDPEWVAEAAKSQNGETDSPDAPYLKTEELVSNAKENCAGVAVPDSGD